MKYILASVLLLFSFINLATESTKVSNLKCKGGWVRAGNSKLEVISYCGEPKHTDVISGANSFKQESLLYTVKGKDYILSFKAGTLVYLGMIK